MKLTILLVLSFLTFSFASPFFKPLTQLINDAGLMTQAVKAVDTVRRMDYMTQKMGVGDISFKCALCGIAINEVEGFIIENKSVTEISQYIENNICDHLGGELKLGCDVLASLTPTIIAKYENRWTVGDICIDLKFCSKPFPHYKENEDVPKFTIDLDLPPSQRWTKICSYPKFVDVGKFFISTLENLLPGQGKKLNEIGETLNNLYFPKEYAQEIEGCSKSMGIPMGWMSLLNIGYEVSDACTSIVAEDKNGKMYHARNLDFWAGLGFTDGLKNATFVAEFQKGGKTLFHGTTFAGFVGLLSGMKPGAFSATVDTRFYPGGIGELFYEIIAAIEERNASLVSFLARDTFMNENNFQGALKSLTTTELIADVYYIMAGVSKNEGVVISRNRINATNVWQLDQDAGRWFEVETNYDHWKPAPWFDDRRQPANNGMNAMGQNDISLTNMFKVLSTKPVLNIQTTYTILTSAATGNYTCYTRWCPYPCTE